MSKCLSDADSEIVQSYVVNRLQATSKWKIFLVNKSVLHKSGGRFITYLQ